MTRGQKISRVLKRLYKLKARPKMGFQKGHKLSTKAKTMTRFEIVRKHKFGVEGVVHYRLQIVKQKRRCKICGRYMKTPHQDHCHKTKKLRALLCGPCNMGLGLFKDDPKLLVKAANYLRRYK